MVRDPVAGRGARSGSARRRKARPVGVSARRRSSNVPWNTSRPPAAPARTDLDHLVRPGHHRGIVFDDQHAVTTAAEVFEQFDHRLDIARVQPHRRFVDHVGHLGQARSEVSDRLDALRFAAGQARGRSGERQVPESDLHHGLEPFSQRGDHRRDVGGIDGVHEVEEFCDLETGHLAGGATEQDRGAGGFVQPVAVAFGTGLRPRETADGVLFAFGQIVGGVQVDAFESRDDALVLLRCLAAQLRRGLTAVQECVAFGLAPLPERGSSVERADIGVQRVPVPAVAEAREHDAAVGERLVEVQEAFDRTGDDFTQARAGGAHSSGVVEREAIRFAHVRCPGARVQQSQVGPGIGDGADGRTGIAADPALIDDDDGGQTRDVFDVGPGPFRQPVPGERRERLAQLVPRLGGDRVEHQ